MDIKMPISMVICYILFIGFEVGAISLSKEQDLELEKELQIRNKPSLATIKTENGDIYDCVDFYKQPAFDHPMLKNHTFHPQMDYKHLEKHPRSSNFSSFTGYQFESFKEGGCPVGSVPIKRTTKSDLIREKYFWSPQKTGVDYALAHTGTGPFSGGSMVAGVYKPAATGQQYSAVRMKIQRGDDAIQVGWRVDPSLTGDDNVRFYLYYKSGQTHCFYTRCPGFVVVNRDYPIDYVFKTHYVAGAKRSVEVEITLARDPANGNWWVEIGNTVRLGFWPANIFTGLKVLGDYVDWGGEVYNTKDKKLVDMGLGVLTFMDARKSAYCRILEVSTPDGRTIDAPRAIEYRSNSDHYRVLNYDYYDNYFRHLIFYGGPYRNF